MNSKTNSKRWGYSMVYRIFSTTGRSVGLHLGPITQRALLVNALDSYLRRNKAQPSVRELTSYTNEMYRREGIEFEPETVEKIFEEIVLETDGRLRNGGTASRLISGSGRYEHDRFTLDYEEHRIANRTNGKTERLTPRELDVLHILIVNAGKIVPSAHILKTVWGARYEGEFTYVRAYVSNLRRKIGDSTKSVIVNTHGTGYSLAEPSNGANALS